MFPTFCRGGRSEPTCPCPQPRPWVKGPSSAIRLIIPNPGGSDSEIEAFAVQRWLRCSCVSAQPFMHIQKENLMGCKLDAMAFISRGGLRNPSGMVSGWGARLFPT